MNFDLYSYIQHLVATNRLARENSFLFCRVSGAAEMEEVIQQWRTHSNFIAVDDFSDGRLFRAPGGGYFTRYIFTIFIFARCRRDDMEDTIAKLSLCRTLRTQLYSRFIRDRHTVEAIRYMNVEEMIFHEYSSRALNGCTGTFMQFNVDIPTSLCYDITEWTE